MRAINTMPPVERVAANSCSISFSFPIGVGNSLVLHRLATHAGGFSSPNVQKQKSSLAKTIACERGRLCRGTTSFRPNIAIRTLGSPMCSTAVTGGTRRSLLVAFRYATRGMYSFFDTHRILHRPTLLSMALPKPTCFRSNALCAYYITFAKTKSTDITTLYAFF